MASTETSGARFTLKRAGEFRLKLAEYWTRRWVRWLAYALAVLLIGWMLILLVFARDLPSVDKLRTYEPPLPTNIRAIEGQPVHSFARERRVQLAYEEYPKQLIHAYLAAEDRTFFSHGGVDYPGIIAALVSNLTRSGRPIGASTITQQVAKNLLLTSEVSYTRKFRDAILAYRIEDALPKEQILELYLNQIFLGRNAYGVQAASRAYFDKDVAQLTLPEMAYLAILPKAPSNYDPERQTARAIGRRNWVLGEMEKNGFITAEQRAAAQAAPLGAVPRQGTRFVDNAGYFMEDVRRQLIQRYGEDAAKGPHSLYAGGLWVRTSLDTRLQQLAETALRDGLVRYDRGRGWHGPIRKLEISGNWAQRLAAANLGAGYPDWRVALVLAKSGGQATIGFPSGQTASMPSYAASMPVAGKGGTAFNAIGPGDVIVVKQEGSAWSLRSIPAVSGAFVVQDPNTGRILAMQGGFDSRLRSFNNATQALRQPGSTIKPFVYAAALDNGMTPASIIVDGSFCVYQSALLGQKCFRNFSGGNAGPQTMRWGIEQSRNLMTVRAASQTGMQAVTRTIARMGIGQYPGYLSIALGAGDTTALKMTNAFSQLVALGRELKPTLIDYIQDRNGKVIYRTDNRCLQMRTCSARDWDGKRMPRPPLRGRQLMDPMTAYQMVHILEGVVERGTATALRDLNRPLMGKTGTTSGPTNVWFIGGSADLIGGIYMGYDQPRSLGGYAQGGRIAAPIFKQFAQEAMKDMPVVPFRAAAGVRMVRIDRRSGRKVFGVFPGFGEAKPAIIWEAFKPESEPRRTIRRAEIAARPKEKAPEGEARVRESRDADFLERAGGIY